MIDISYDTLKQRQRKERENYSENLGLRVHRALSWLNKSEQCDDDFVVQSLATITILGQALVNLK